MVIVDSHCHASRSWYGPVESLLSELDRNGVESAILIQIQGEYDNSYQADCVRRYPGRLSSVVFVDTSRPDAPATLARLAANGARGLRLNAATRSPGEDPLAIWRAAARLRLPVSCVGTPAAFAADDFAALVGSLPELPIVVEHLGGLTAADVQTAPADRSARSDARRGATAPPDGQGQPSEACRRVLALSRFPNTLIKIHGLGEFARRAMPVSPDPFERPIPPLLELAYAAFGPRRMMWGSDYPPVAGREGYRNALQLALEEFSSRPRAERELIFGRVAAATFGL